MHEDNLRALLGQLNLKGVEASALEILGEKALTQGHIDLLLKERVPLGSAIKIPIEVKMNKAQLGDIAQLRGYMDELLGECPIGILVASGFSKDALAKAAKAGIKTFRYGLTSDLKTSGTFEEIYQGLSIQPFEK